jgi:hypothetical protein
MIVKNYIISSLTELEVLYNNSSSQKKAIYFSKLALIEFCGWIENAMDNIILVYSNKNLTQEANKKYILKTVVGRTYGFDYETNFRPMMIRTIGIREVEKLELKLQRNGAQVSILKSTLSTLKVKRNENYKSLILTTPKLH